MTYTDIQRAAGLVTGLAAASQLSTPAVIGLFTLALLSQIGRALRWFFEDGPVCVENWLEVLDLVTSRRPPPSGDP
jgi:hypothetical protein